VPSLPRCPFRDDDEDLLHLFYRCPRLLTWFAALGIPAAASVDSLSDVCAAILTPFLAHPPPVRHTLLLLVLWITWKSTNRMVFDSARLSRRQLCLLLVKHCELWLHRLPRRLSRQAVDSWLVSLRNLPPRRASRSVTPL
jgi:hypothetical protein